MRVETIEILLVVAIVAFQIHVFLRTWRQIRLFKIAIPGIETLRFSTISIPAEDLKKLSPRQILSNISMYKNAEMYSTVQNQENGVKVDNYAVLDVDSISHSEKSVYVKVNIIESDGNDNQIFDRILMSINTYLLRNRGASSDFILIKDIVERNTNTIEEEINSSVGIPLYLGLMGTMVGIVLGLFNMPALDSIKDATMMDTRLNEGISLLIGGVKIAMIASFVGLLFTIIITGWHFKGSRAFVEGRKNDFYTFIQVELLPLVNQGLAATLDSLQRNLLRFNDEFASNLSGLGGMFESSSRAIREQKELIEALDKAKVSEMTRYNVSVLKELSVSVSQFERFNMFLQNLSQVAGNTESILRRTNELLDRTENFKSIADGLDNKLNQSQALLDFLSSHFTKLEEHKVFTSAAVADVGHSISETFKQLNEQILISSETVKQFTVDETDLLKKALSEGKTNLANLEHLESLKIDVALLKNSTASQGERLRQSIDEMNRKMEKSIAVLEQIEKQSDRNASSGFMAYFQSLFKSKNK
jgi:hypothetical protein